MVSSGPMADAVEEWVLYVDESGDFESDPCSCVIGLALREREELEGARRGLAAAWGEVEGGEGARLVERRLAREHGLRLVVLGRERLELIGGHLQQPHLHVAQRACRVLLGVLAPVRSQL